MIKLQSELQFRVGISSMISVTFTYLTGLKRCPFHNARLAGSWNRWAEIPMTTIVAEDGCLAFTKTIEFDDSHTGQKHRWGVRLDAPGAPNAWAINLEVPDPESQSRYREFRLPSAGSSVEEKYFFTEARRLGAQKFYADSSTPAPPHIKFLVWAPNAENVQVVFSQVDHGYIFNDGTGIDASIPAIPLTERAGGVWESSPISDFAGYVGLPYMFQIENAQGETVFRTDIHSRWQIGRGDRNPAKHS